MALGAGARLGPYEILSVLGAGGMGEVYRARDTRLDRIVAIKVLAAHLAERPELRERFEREARTIGSLNHPHICTLHDIGRQDGIDYLVMEHLEGETLAQRLLTGPLPLDLVLRYAIEISDALDKAHRRGVIHRDLKPGNVMLTKSGSKLLDFGLAKLTQEAAHGSPLSQLPTMKGATTAEGTILGTVQYMAPEQIEAGEVDARTDIFAFGAVVYEMATGKKAFEGKNSASVMAKILEVDPPSMASLQPMTPPALDHVVKKCLAKEPDKRWHAASDLTDELTWIAEGGSQAGMPAPVVRRRNIGERVAWAVAAIAFVIAALGVWGAYFRRAPAEAPAVHFTIGPPEKGNFSPDFGFLTVSPDGAKLAFIARDATGISHLWIRALDSATAQPLSGTENPSQPFWSPDSRFLAFFADGKLKKIAVSGGPAQTLAQTTPGSGTWSREGVVLFSTGAQGTIYRVSAAGGAATLVTMLDTSRQENGLYWPYFLPDAKHFLYFARSLNAANSAIYVGSLDSKAKKLVLNASSNSVYVPPGYLLFNREGTVMAQPFDADRLQLTGEAVPIAEGVQFASAATGSRANLAASENGVLAYRAGGSVPRRRLVWVSRNGAEQPLPGSVRAYQQPRLSPDGRRVAVQILEQGNQIWLYDLARDTLTRLTFEGNENAIPLWTPDGQRIAFYSIRGGPRNLFWQMADGTGGQERLTNSEYLQTPNSWSPDGQLLAFHEVSPTTGRDIWVLRLSDRKAQPFLRTPFNEGAASFSPDGHWVAYTSDESGRPEIYAQPYPGPGGKWQISTEGGTEPMWNRNGRELFYRNGDKMVAAAITTQPSVSASRPQALFEKPYVRTQFPNTLPYYDVSRDGQRFLMVKEGEQVSAPIEVVLNWFEELKRRVPSGK
jgi:Tol biopolymer transport system component